VRVREATELGAKCQERSAALLPHLSSLTSARDVDRVRIALGEQQIRFMGFSGGSVLATTYLAKFPRQVAAMVLDSPFDPDQFVNQAFDFDIDQMVATERTLSTFFRWCKDTPALCAFGNGDPRGAFEQLLAKVKQNRIDHPGRWDIVTDGSLIDFISGAMLFPQNWPAVSQQLAGMAADPLPAAPMPTGDDRGFAEYYSQTCLDRTFPTSLREFDKQLLRSIDATQYLGGRYGYAEFKCRQWPADPTERYTGPFTNPRNRPVLVLTATDDPLAPHRGAVRLAGRLQAALVVLQASGHLQFGHTPCADAKVNEFLRTGAAPRYTACSVPLPGH
jgi:pimeloyl-ACP methyl ester carboxylesterase